MNVLNEIGSALFWSLTISLGIIIAVAIIHLFKRLKRRFKRAIADGILGA